MNIGLIEKTNFSKIKAKIKSTYETIFKEKLNFASPIDSQAINILILNAYLHNDLFKFFSSNLNENSVILVNIDNKDLINIASVQNYDIVTFGYNPKSTITLSSFITGDKTSATICIQRDILTLSNILIEEQEFQITTIFSELDTLLIVSALLILDIPIDYIKSALSTK